VFGSWFRAQGSRLGVKSLGFGINDLRLRVWGLGFGINDLGLRV